MNTIQIVGLFVAVGGLALLASLIQYYKKK